MKFMAQYEYDDEDDDDTHVNSSFFSITDCVSQKVVDKKVINSFIFFIMALITPALNGGRSYFQGGGN